MDTILLKTFLEVTHARNFGKASEILCVAPSTVSARIRQLEELLGLSLFIRNHQQVSLTPAGEHMVRHARFILNAWERAYEDIALSANLNKRLVVAGTPSLWDIFVQDWLNEVHSKMPELALRAEDSTTLRVMEKLERGSIDIGFIYEQPKLANLVIEELKSIPLQLVSTQPGLDADQATSSGYIRVEWGSVFNSLHERYFPQRPLAPVRVNSMRIAMKLMLSSGGSAYLPVISTADRVSSGELFVVEDAPQLEMKAYAAYSPHGEHHDLIKQLLAML